VAKIEAVVASRQLPSRPTTWYNTSVATSNAARVVAAGLRGGTPLCSIAARNLSLRGMRPAA